MLDGIPSFLRLTKRDPRAVQSFRHVCKLDKRVWVPAVCDTVPGADSIQFFTHLVGLPGVPNDLSHGHSGGADHFIDSPGSLPHMAVTDLIHVKCALHSLDPGVLELRQNCRQLMGVIYSRYRHEKGRLAVEIRGNVRF